MLALDDWAEELGRSRCRLEVYAPTSWNMVHFVLIESLRVSVGSIQEPFQFTAKLLLLCGILVYLSDTDVLAFRSS